MSERKVGLEEYDRYDFLADTGEVFEVGNAVFGDPASGKAVVGQSGTGMTWLGHSRANVTGTGTNTVSVELARHMKVFAFDFTAGSITAADVFKSVYATSGSAVTLTATGNSRTGLLIGFNDYGQALVATGW